MQSFVPFIFVLNFFGPLSALQDNDSSICRLTDAPNQCGAFCLSALHPLMDNNHKSQMKLDRIERGVESLKNASQGHFGALSSQIKNAFQFLLQMRSEDQLKLLQESLQKAFTKEDFETALNVTEDHLLCTFKSQLQDLQSKMKGQEDTIRTKLDIQLHKKLEDQSKSLLQSSILFKEEFLARLNGSELKLMAGNSQIEYELQMLQTKVKKQETAIQTKMSASLQVLGNEFKSHLKPLQESLQRSITKEELKNQLKELHTKINQTQDQNTALFESFETRLNGTEGQLRMFESKMEAQLKELQNRNENQLMALENQQSAFQKTLLESQSDIYHKITHPKFERIGSRYFYIEHKIMKTWDEAAETCRGMGGYLAAFKTQEELTAIRPKLIESSCCWYWTGIKKEDGKFISTASGKPATVFKWKEGFPDNSGACVMLDNRGMFDYYCSFEAYFICQSDNET